MCTQYYISFDYSISYIIHNSTSLQITVYTTMYTIIDLYRELYQYNTEYTRVLIAVLLYTIVYDIPSMPQYYFRVLLRSQTQIQGIRLPSLLKATCGYATLESQQPHPAVLTNVSTRGTSSLPTGDNTQRLTRRITNYSPLLTLCQDACLWVHRFICRFAENLGAIAFSLQIYYSTVHRGLQALETQGITL